MRKFSMLFGALGGAVAGYLLSNDKLREDLVRAKNPEAAAKALSKHLRADGKKVAHEMKKFAESEDVQRNLQKAKKFAMVKLEEAKSGMKSLVKKGKSSVRSAVSRKAGKGRNGTFKEEKV